MTACVATTTVPLAALRIVAPDAGRPADGDLVRRAQEGDLGAFEELYRHNVGKIYGLCLRMARDPDRAEELTQEVFIRAWRKLSTFRGASAFSSWLYRLAVNLVLGRARARQRRRARIVATDDLTRIDSPAVATKPVTPPLDLEKAIRALPPQARMVFILHEVEGYKHAEIADMTGLAVGTSKAHLHRARKLLRGELDS